MNFGQKTGVLDFAAERTTYEKRKICIYLKALVHRFPQKFAISSTWLLCKIDQEKVSGDVLVGKQVFRIPL